MNVDHIYIFTNDLDGSAEELLNFGFIEGSSRIHHGQGTKNRKFYFENFFLELITVYDEKDIFSERVQKIHLHERAFYQRFDASPFGLCLVKSDDEDLLFQNAIRYQPDYFPPKMFIQVLSNYANKNLPWTFRINKDGFTKNEEEPLQTQLNINKLSQISFEYQGEEVNDFLKHFDNKNHINFKNAERNHLTLVFDDEYQQQSKTFEDLFLTIKF